MTWVGTKTRNKRKALYIISKECYVTAIYILCTPTRNTL